MPSNFDSMFAAAAVPNELAQFGEDVSYTPSGGQEKTIKAIVQRESRSDEFGAGAQTNDYNTMVIRISARNNTEGHVDVQELEAGAAPDVVEIDGKTWIVQRKLSAGPMAGTWRLLLSDAGNDEGD